MASHKKSVRWGSIRKHCHVEKCIDPLTSITYCSKDNKVTEWGDRPVFDKKKRALLAKDLVNLTIEDYGEMKPREALVNKKCANLMLTMGL